jgi:hypothetical protein
MDQPVQQVLANGATSNANAVWRPPHSGFIKFDWDIAINQHEGCICVGRIARDCMEQFLGARSRFHQLRLDAKLAETIAAPGRSSQ